MGRKLIALSFSPSSELPEPEELKAFLAREFGRRLPGFAALETDVTWGEVVLDLLGVVTGGQLVAVFPEASRQERAFHDVISRALVASTWLEENREAVERRFGDRGIKADQPLRLIVVAPVGAAGSRALSRALERAGVEVMGYSIYEIEAGEEKVLALSFDGEGAAPRPAAPATGPGQAAAAEPARAEAPREAPAPRKPPSAVEVFIASLPDPNLKAMSEQILAFLVGRFPSAEGVVGPQERGFTLTVGAEHLATIRFDKGALWLEVGPERIPTNKIKDSPTLERAMNLPSVLDALGSVRAG
jgi:hypothetical protein